MPGAHMIGPVAGEGSRGLVCRKFIRAALFICCAMAAAISLPTPARAWGCKGHQIIALLAERHLTPKSLAAVNKILTDSPIDPSLSRYCKDHGTDPMTDAATWPDDYRPGHPETGPWHYIDIPRGTTIRGNTGEIAKEVEKFCDPKEGCVTRAITDDLAVLRSPGSDPQKKADALRFLIHFVGDLHQPLHGITNNDQGGNCVPVSFFDAQPQLRNPQTESYAPNLHGVWDTNILERATSGKTVAEVAADLDQSFGGKIARWQKGKANLDAWAAESFQLASKKVYGKLPVQIPVEAPHSITSCADDNHISARMLKFDERLEDPYQNMAAPIVRQRAAQAGARLAMLLNGLWP
jgi:hypothetical protein